MEDRPLHFALPEDDILNVVGYNKLNQLKKHTKNISSLSIPELKRIITLHNNCNDLTRGSPSYVKCTGKKAILIDRVEKILYRPTAQPHGSQNNGNASQLQKRPLSVPTKPPTKQRKLPNAICKPAETPWEEWWESEKVDFYHCQNPFWKEEQQLQVTPIEPPSGYSSKYPTYERKGNFNLTSEQLKQIRDSSCTVHFRLYNKHSRNDAEWLNMFSLKVNHNQAQLMRKKTRTAPVSEPFIIHPAPVFEKHVFRENNQFSFNCPHAHSGYLVIQLVSPISTDTIIANTKSTYAEGTKKEDDDLCEVSLKVGVRCPLGFTRIENPAKGAYCTHVQCFDIEVRLIR
eukprot:CAMPEP_0206211470 /NCGR_PEP_ID=MMETSP0166-20121206/18159_1 /ASSEMBLY_ACC=CAM_ASM_000260 /TAXON_ID=95228 /ORGANISM="Vannella robusta, Strain DIVA3 518/3/11/1/6" /LENGTH=343 /DNA_ID=CAMNT_0053633335 /DNA_START=35 /DNA_END=1066 /DNA_ORIENTATION=-